MPMAPAICIRTICSVCPIIRPRFGADSERVRNTGSLSFRTGQLEDQTQSDSELWLALGTEYAHHRHRPSRADLPARAEQHRLPMRGYCEHRLLVAKSDWPGGAGRQRSSTGLTQTYYKSFAPRIGIAWSPGIPARPAFAPAGACSTTRLSNSCSSSSARSLLLEEASSWRRRSSTLHSSVRTDRQLSSIHSTASSLRPLARRRTGRLSSRSNCSEIFNRTCVRNTPPSTT